MSIYATNFITDEETGEKKLVKHLNKIRIDRGGWNRYSHAKGWNKSGKKARMEKCSFRIGALKSRSPKFKGFKRLWNGLSELQTKFDSKEYLGS